MFEGAVSFGEWEVNVEGSWSQAAAGEAGSAPAAQGRWHWLLRVASEMELGLCVSVISH